MLYDYCDRPLRRIRRIGFDAVGRSSEYRIQVAKEEPLEVVHAVGFYLPETPEDGTDFEASFSALKAHGN